MQGQFPVLARGAAGELVAVFRTGAGHYGLSENPRQPRGRSMAAAAGPIRSRSRRAATMSAIRTLGIGLGGDGRWLLAY